MDCRGCVESGVKLSCQRTMASRDDAKEKRIAASPLDLETPGPVYMVHYGVPGTATPTTTGAPPTATVGGGTTGGTHSDWMCSSCRHPISVHVPLEKLRCSVDSDSGPKDYPSPLLRPQQRRRAEKAKKKGRPDPNVYKRVREPKPECEEKPKSDDNAIRVVASRGQRKYIKYAIETLNGTEGKEKSDSVVLTGMGNAVNNVVNVVEILKRRVKGLHQTTEISSETMTDKYEAIVEGGNGMEIERKVSVIQIVLSTAQLDKNHPGYQAPLPESEVTDEDIEDEKRERRPRKKKAAAKKDGDRKPREKKEGDGDRREGGERRRDDDRAPARGGRGGARRDDRDERRNDDHRVPARGRGGPSMDEERTKVTPSKKERKERKKATPTPAANSNDDKKQQRERKKKQDEDDEELLNAHITRLHGKEALDRIEDQNQDEEQGPTIKLKEAVSAMDLLTRCDRAWLDPRQERIRAFGRAFGKAAVESVATAGGGTQQERNIRATPPPQRGPTAKFRDAPFATADPKTWPRFSALRLRLSQKGGVAPGGESSGALFVLDDSSDDFKASQEKFERLVSQFGDADALIRLHQQQPYHLPTLLQLHSTLLTMGDHGRAQDVLDMALYTVGYIFSMSSFPLTGVGSGRCLPYSEPSNKVIFIVLQRGIHQALRKGCGRTALELTKFVLSLDGTDPKHVLLSLDYCALRGSQFEWLIAFLDALVKEQSPLAALPSLHFNAALASFLLQQRNSKNATAGAGSPSAATDRMCDALRLFPNTAIALGEKLGENPLGSAGAGPWADFLSTVEGYTGTDNDDALRHVSDLFADRSYDVWKPAPVLDFLKGCLATVATDSDDRRLASKQRRERYLATGTLSRYISTSSEDLLGELGTAIPRELLQDEATYEEYLLGGGGGYYDHSESDSDSDDQSESDSDYYDAAGLYEPSALIGEEDSPAGRFFRTWMEGPRESIRLEGLQGMTSVGGHWLSSTFSTALKTATFKDLPELGTVGGYWMDGCTSLETVRFEELPKLKSVGAPWLSHCPALKEVTFKHLPELGTVGGYWMKGCTSLETVRFEQLPKLKSVGDYWLADCPALKEVTFKHLPELGTVGGHWMKGCTSLETVHFEQLPKLKSVGDCWLADCPALKEVTFKHLPELGTVGGYWMDGCTSVETVRFEELPKLKSVGASWLSHCPALKEVTFKHLPELGTVGGYWMDGCTSLETVRFEELPKLKSVGDFWLADCPALKEVTFKHLPELGTVGGYWMKGCTSLETVRFEQLPKLKSVGDYWLAECPALKEVTFKDLPELETVGMCWLKGCTSLETVRFEELPKLNDVAGSWLMYCRSLRTVHWQGFMHSSVKRHRNLPELIQISCPTKADLESEISKLEADYESAEYSDYWTLADLMMTLMAQLEDMKCDERREAEAEERRTRAQRAWEARAQAKDESESDSDSDYAALAPRHGKAAANSDSSDSGRAVRGRPARGGKVAANSDSSDSDDDKPIQRAVRGGRRAQAKDESESDSDSDDAAPAPRAARGRAAKSDTDDTDTDEDAGGFM